MLNITLDEQNKIATIEPVGKLSGPDFLSAVNIIDPLINDVGKLNGLIISSEKFPGWQDFSAFVSHLSFVKEHHKKIAYIALVTDTPIANLAEHIVTHFTSAEIKAFKFSELQTAIEWITNNN
jgi:hypothetical protein